MCFSPEMDLAAAVVIGVVAVDTLRQTRRPAEIGLAALPAVFAIHQLTEAFVWWGLQDQMSDAITTAATHVYLAIAWLFPVFVPVAVFLVQAPRRRYILGALVAVGAVTTTLLTRATLDGPVTASIQGHHLSYDVDLAHPVTVVSLYVAATCGALLVSSDHRLRVYGLVNLPVVGALAVLSQSGLVSLWCLWAALTSVAIDVHLRTVHRARPGGPPQRGGGDGADSTDAGPPEPSTARTIP